MESIIPMSNKPQSITSIIFPHGLQFGSTLRDYSYTVTLVAKRFPHIKKLVLPDAYALSMSNVSKTFGYWKSLEEVSISNFYNKSAARIIKKLSINYKTLHTLTINLLKFCFREDWFVLTTVNAELIAKSLRLKKFDVIGCAIEKEAAKIIMGECKQLVNLCLSKCYSSWPCLYGLKLRCLRDEMIEKQIDAINSSEFNSSDTIKWRVYSRGEQQLFTKDEFVNSMFIEPPMFRYGFAP